MRLFALDVAAVLTLVVAAPLLRAQEPARAACEAAGAAWLATDQIDEAELGKVVNTLMREPAVGLQWLAEQLPMARKHPLLPRSKGVMTLVTHTTLEFLRREHASDWRFAGQFDPLAVLQPVVGEQLFYFLLQTPEWYPHTHRTELVPALRDLQILPPTQQRIAAVQAIANDAEREPTDLRRALSGLLWQWGEKESAQKWIDDLQQACGEGDAEDRVRAMLELAEFQYQLRDYRSCARTHRSLAEMARGTSVVLKPIDHYSAACAYNLSGQRERAFEALKTCLDLMADKDLDSSHRLTRDLFLKDPEIAALRTDPRFLPLLDRAVTAPAKSEERKKR